MDDYPNGFVGHHFVTMPPDYRGEESTYAYAFFERDLDANEIKEFFLSGLKQGLPNPRPITPTHLSLSSLFHPGFYQGLVKNFSGLKEEVKQFLQELAPLQLTIPTHSQIAVDSIRYYLQTVVFLAGCTLSAAIIQRRFSASSLESKLNRLWQIHQYAIRYDLQDIIDLKIDQFIQGQLSNPDPDDLQRLIHLKRFFGKVAAALDKELKVEWHHVDPVPLTADQKDRFGFINDLKDYLGDNLACVLVYGSAADSSEYGDYDLMVLVNDEQKALSQLAETNPYFHKRELNMSVYDFHDFAHFQALAGDNLDRNGICLFGDADIAAKPKEDLIVRNFSFSHFRMRQLMGLAGSISVAGDDANYSDNLMEYFIKIPIHVVKGVHAASGYTPSKAWLINFCLEHADYNLEQQAKNVSKGEVLDVICEAYRATSQVMEKLNELNGVYSRKD